MAQTLVFNDIDVELEIDSSAAGTDLLVTGTEGQRVVAAVRNLKRYIPTLRKVIWDQPGGGLTGRLGIWADGTPRILYLNFDSLTQPSPNYYYTFVNGSWTEQEIDYVAEIRDAILDFNTGHTVTAVDGFVPPPISDTLWDGLGAYYPLNEASGTRYDTRSSNHASVTGGVTSLAGKNGDSAQFSSTGYLTVPYNAACDFGAGGNGASMSFWFKRSANPSAFGIFARENAAANPSFSTQITTGGVLAFSCRGGGSNSSATAGSGLCDDVWHHAVLTFNFSDKLSRIYLDGGAAVLAGGAASSGTLDTNTVGFLIGAANGGASLYGVDDPTHAQIDELAMWPDRCLSDDEASDLYQGSLGRFF